MDFSEGPERRRRRRGGGAKSRNRIVPDAFSDDARGGQAPEESTAWWRFLPSTTALFLLGLLVIAGGGILVIKAVHNGHRSTDPPAAVAVASSSSSPAPFSSPTSASAAPPPAPDCVASSGGGVTVGRGAGGQGSGPAVIEAFDWAYYAVRSGAAARSVVSSDAQVGSAQDIQSGINATDPATKYCLEITDRGNGVFGVKLTQEPPTGPAVVIHQQVTTKVVNGKYWISGISSDPHPPSS